MRARLFPSGCNRDAEVIRIDTFPVVISRDDDGRVYVNRSFDCEVLCLIDEDEGNLIIRDLTEGNHITVNGMPIIEGGLMPGDILNVENRSYVISYERVTSRPPITSSFHFA